MRSWLGRVLWRGEGRGRPHSVNEFFTHVLEGFKEHESQPGLSLERDCARYLGPCDELLLCPP